jgi:hypothetical protein
VNDRSRGLGSVAGAACDRPPVPSVGMSTDDCPLHRRSTGDPLLAWQAVLTGVIRKARLGRLWGDKRLLVVWGRIGGLKGRVPACESQASWIGSVWIGAKTRGGLPAAAVERPFKRPRSTARSRRYYLVVCLASSRAYLLRRTRSLFRDSRREFGVGVDDCVSSHASVSAVLARTLARL